MPLLFYQPAGKGRGRVYLEHYQPEILPEEFRKKGVWVDEIPAPPPHRPGEIPVMYVSPETGEVWYEYEYAPGR
jgi:hypothetical protein